MKQKVYFDFYILSNPVFFLATLAMKGHQHCASSNSLTLIRNGKERVHRSQAWDIMRQFVTNFQETV
jgi:hypothetical protein